MNESWRQSREEAKKRKREFINFTEIGGICIMYHWLKEGGVNATSNRKVKRVTLEHILIFNADHITQKSHAKRLLEIRK